VGFLQISVPLSSSDPKRTCRNLRYVVYSFRVLPRRVVVMEVDKKGWRESDND